MTPEDKVKVLREALDKCGWVLHFAADMTREHSKDLPHPDKTLLDLKSIMREHQEALSSTEGE